MTRMLYNLFYVITNYLHKWPLIARIAYVALMY